MINIFFLTIEIIICLLFLLIFGGLFNYLIQKRVSLKINLSWFHPNNIININGILTHIVIKGDGEPLIFIHGSQMNVYDWRYNIDFFSKYFKVYAFDMVGCGFTDKPNVDYSPAFFSQFIYNVMKHFNIQKASFIASSWGGGHVFYFSLKYPNKVKKLVMSSPCGLRHNMTVLDKLLTMPVVGTVLALYGNQAIVERELQSVFVNKIFVTKEFIDSVYKPLFMEGGLRATIRSYQKADFFFVQSSFDKINVPVLLIWGSKDLIHPLWMMEEMKHQLPKCEACVFKNVGHLPHEEASDEFNKCALKFLRYAK
jgi:pimeloyl-ACP methyl ester carboxylesterase